MARTIADLAASPAIQTEHVSEAIQYRNLAILDLIFDKEKHNLKKENIFGSLNP